MSGKVIYEERFPDLMRKLDDTKDGGGQPDLSPSSQDPVACIRNLFDKTVSVLIPERVRTTKAFIRQAKQIGHGCCMDTVIEEEDSRITVTYTLTDGVDFSCLKDLIAMADELSCGAERGEILLSVVYYTHATYCDGRRVFPTKR